MALKKINEEPKITDSILFELTAPGADGCFTADPYKIDKVVIYYVERDFLGSNFGEYTKTTFDENIQAELDQAQKDLCDDPTELNVFKVNQLKLELDSSSQKHTFYYKERITIEVFGSEGFPAWIASDADNSRLTLVSEDEDGNPQFGRFTLEWSPQGSVREGDYFICWTWTPLPAGDQLSAHLPFVLNGDPKAVITIPTHVTPDEKYNVLLERYLPEVYKYTLADADLTPQVMDLFNKSVGKGFKFMEDMANQIIDLFDANALHESLLVYLSNFFNIKLKSSDPTLWRRQIKQAVPLYKKKGTLQGLQDAFAQAGMTLNKFTQYWQIVSPYTWVETFKVTDSASFKLSKDTIVLPIITQNFGLWLKRANTTVYNVISKDYVTFEYDDEANLVMTWIGDELSASPVDLFVGDRIKVMYQYTEIPGPTQQNLENYIRSLPLMDQRDEDDQEFPPKNWNVRLIAEDDTLFDTLIPVRHPFANWLIFGDIRTEFAYSENIYNMDEYNGSTRPSTDPCHIDKSFIDPCGACLSTNYSVDVSVEELSNDRMVEAQDVLREFTPFHSRLHSINFVGEVNEFVQSPVESIDFLVSINKSQFILSGQSNPFFHRIMEGGLSDWIITRNDLTEQNTVLSGQSGLAYNEGVYLVAPDLILQDLGIMEEAHIMEVLSPSANAGTYKVKNVKGKTALVATTVIEPLNETAFNFNISNVPYGNTTTSITEDNLYKFSDANIDFAELGVKTLWDVDNTPDYTGGSWKVSIPAYRVAPYLIDDIVNGILHLDGDATLPLTTTSGISYTLLDDNDVVKGTSTSGHLEVQRRGYVNLNDPYLDPVSEFIKAGDYLYYAGNEYLILEFDESNFWIDNYTSGNVAGVSIQSRRRIVNQQIGIFGYRGLRLQTASNHESGFGMVNGSNPPVEDLVTDNSLFKENFLFLIGSDYYKIASIDQDEVVLSGRDQNWKTLAAGGTAVTYSLVHLTKQIINVGFIVFDHLDRDGHDPIVREIYSSVDETTTVAALSVPEGTGLQENVAQEEGINFTIETRNGEQYEGEL